MKKSLSIILLASALFSQKLFGATGCYVRAKSVPVNVKIDYGLAEGWTLIKDATDDKTKKDRLPFLGSKSGKRKVFIKYDKDIYVTDVFTYPDVITISKDNKGKVIYTMKTTTWEYKNKEAKKLTESEFFEKRKVDKSIIEKYKSSLKDAKVKIKGMTDLQELKNTLKIREDIIKTVSGTIGYNKERLIYEIAVKIELQKRIYELKAAKAKIDKKTAEDKVKAENANLEKMNKESLEKIKIFEKEQSTQKEKDAKIKKEKEEEKIREAKKDAEVKKAQDEATKQEDELKKRLEALKKLEAEEKKIYEDFSKIGTNSANLDKKEVSAPEIKDEAPPAFNDNEFELSKKKPKEQKASTSKAPDAKEQSSAPSAKKEVTPAQAEINKKLKEAVEKRKKAMVGGNEDEFDTSEVTKPKIEKIADPTKKDVIKPKSPAEKAAEKAKKTTVPGKSLGEFIQEDPKQKEMLEKARNERIKAEKASKKSSESNW